MQQARPLGLKSALSHRPTGRAVKPHRTAPSISVEGHRTAQ